MSDKFESEEFETPQDLDEDGGGGGFEEPLMDDLDDFADEVDEPDDEEESEGASPSAARAQEAMREASEMARGVRLASDGGGRPERLGS